MRMPWMVDPSNAAGSSGGAIHTCSTPWLQRRGMDIAAFPGRSVAIAGTTIRLWAGSDTAATTELTTSTAKRNLGRMETSMQKFRCHRQDRHCDPSRRQTSRTRRDHAPAPAKKRRGPALPQAGPQRGRPRNLTPYLPVPPVVSARRPRPLERYFKNGRRTRARSMRAP